MHFGFKRFDIFVAANKTVFYHFFLKIAKIAFSSFKCFFELFENVIQKIFEAGTTFNYHLQQVMPIDTLHMHAFTSLPING